MGNTIWDTGIDLLKTSIQFGEVGWIIDQFLIEKNKDSRLTVNKIQ